MLIILEGPDGSGKSTLAGKLAAHLTTRDGSTLILHKGPPEAHPIDEYLRPLTDYLPGTGEHIILDRWHWGERVYPRVRGRESQLDAASWWAIEAYLNRLGAFVIKCDSTREGYELTFQMKSRECDEWQLNELSEVQAGYREAWRESQLARVTYNWMHADDVTKLQVADYLQLAGNRERYGVELNMFSTYLGPRYPKTLLFGDVRHGFNLDSTHLDPAHSDANKYPRDPAFLPFRATSGHFLLSALTAADWTDFGLANACDVDDPVELWKTLEGPKVVALGRNAHRKLSEAGLPHGVAAHPQFARRFHHKRSRDYAWTITDAAETGRDHSQWLQSSRVSTASAPTPTSSSGL